MTKRIKILSLLSICVVIFLVAPTAHAATLQQLLQRQADLQKQAADSQKKINQTKQEATTLQDTISGIDEDIASTTVQIQNTEDQIGTTNDVITALNGDIVKTSAHLDELNDKLRQAYISLYELSQTNTSETLIEHDSLDEVVSQTQYIQAIQTNLQQNISEANAAKADLESKKKDSQAQKDNLLALKGSLDTANNHLNDQKQQKNYLLSQTQGEQVKYESLLASIQKDASTVNDQIKAIYEAAARNSRKLTTGGTGGYAYASWPMDVADAYGFLTRECTSYVAWKWNEVDGYSWYRNPLPDGVPSGNAKYWIQIAQARGYTIASTPSPQSVAVWSGGTYGHVAIVESVNGDGSFTVSEYNFSPPFGGQFDTRTTTVTESSMGTPHFIRPPR